MQIQGYSNFSLTSTSVSATTTLNSSGSDAKNEQERVKQEAKQTDLSVLSMQYILEFQFGITETSSKNTQAQSALSDPKKLADLLKTIDYSFTGYEGKPLEQLSQEEAAALISEDGYFGITQTSDRMADFVMQGAKGDAELLQKGREAVLKGYKEAEKLFGGELPEISKKTLERTLEKIDEAIRATGSSVLDQQA